MTNEQMTLPSGQIIKQMREDRLLSVLELSRLSGVSFETIKTYEAGKRVPQVKTIRKLLEAFKKFDNEKMNQA